MSIVLLCVASMWRRILILRKYAGKNLFSSASYSFLDPNIFSIPREAAISPSKASVGVISLLSEDQLYDLQASFHHSIRANDTDQAWKHFRDLTSSSSFLFSSSSNVFNALITTLCSSNSSPLNLKRAFACSILLIEKNPNALNFDSVCVLLTSIRDANLSAPAFTLVNSMLRNRYFMPFALWGDLLIEITRRNGKFAAFFKIFQDTCKVSMEEKLDFMIPSLSGCKTALQACCHDMSSFNDADIVIEKMSIFGIKPDEETLGILAFFYASKGLKHKVSELHSFFESFNFPTRTHFFSNLILGYLKSGDIFSVSESILSTLKSPKISNFNDDLYSELIKGVLKHGSVKDLASIIIKSHEIEPNPSTADFRNSIGFGIISACVRHGMLDKAHSIIDELDAGDRITGIAVYAPILGAYCKEYRTAEATKLAMKISNAGLHLDTKSYEALIEASMASQDFHSAFTLFRDMRAANVENLKGSYLTIMTGLMESHRPELMAAFMDDVAEDPRVEVRTHEWNSIIHAFCKGGRLEDAKRTFRRMVFLQYQPNAQTYLSLINGYVSEEKYFSVLMLWTDLKRHVAGDEGLVLDANLVDALMYALVKGGFFDAVMEVVEKSEGMRIFVDKWRYKQAFMETHKKLKVARLRRKSVKKMESLLAFKNWAGLST